MKDVHGEGQIKGFVALRSKMYAVRVEKDEEDWTDELKAKGVKRNAMTDMTYDKYVECLRHCTKTKHRFKQIRSHKHNLVTHDTEKVGLCSFDDKRYILPCGIHSVAYGHYKTKQSKPQCSFCVEQLA